MRLMNYQELIDQAEPIDCYSYIQAQTTEPPEIFVIKHRMKSKHQPEKDNQERIKRIIQEKLWMK